VFHRLGRPSPSSVSTGRLAGVPDLERPPAVAVALDATISIASRHALIGSDAGVAQILEPPQHVVVPPRGKAKRVHAGWPRPPPGPSFLS